MGTRLFEGTGASADAPSGARFCGASKKKCVSWSAKAEPQEHVIGEVKPEQLERGAVLELPARDLTDSLPEEANGCFAQSLQRCVCASWSRKECLQRQRKSAEPCTGR